MNKREKMSRFDYVKYDQRATNQQLHLKEEFEKIEAYVNKFFNDGRAKSLLLTSLEEAYMWAGKAIRDDQVKRNGSAPLQEERANS